MKLIEQHLKEIQSNLERWKSKPLLREIYRDFHKTIAQNLKHNEKGLIVELGSGMGNIKQEIPECICTDLFDNPWIDQLENAYKLNFSDSSISNLILIDVFHHLRYPGQALEEFHRVLQPGGRVIILDPCLSLLGFLVYGVAHHEPISVFDEIEWLAPNSHDNSYYAAQGNAYRVFFGKKKYINEDKWSVVLKEKISAFSYILSGGFSKKQLYPTQLYPLFKKLDRILDLLPLIFACRMIVVLEKT